MDLNITGHILSTYNYIGNNWLLAAIIGGIVVAILLFIFQDKIIPFCKESWRIIVNFVHRDSYKYIGLRKHITVYNNGHGIILQDIELKINNPDKPLEKILDISDAPSKCEFPSLQEMRNTPVEERFNKFGFWFSSNPKDVVTDVIEVERRSNSKRKVLQFIFDKDAAKKLGRKPLKILYGFSIPSLHPLTDGKYDANLGGTNPIMSEFEVKYPLDYMHYVIGLENGVKVNSKEAIHFKRGEENPGTDIAIQDKDDLFYSKFFTKIEKPRLGSLISTRFTIE
jgi:hypothetical protein